jgi:UDP-3-O-[3-hydroxymyristoyl] glucosamine N-acyltransferase
LAQKVGAHLGAGADPAALIHDVRTLADAGAGHVTFLDNRKYLGQLAATRATACLVAPAFAARVPEGVGALMMAQPYRGFAAALQLFYPDAMMPKAAMAQMGDPPIHPSARIEEGVKIETGAIIGREAQIGRGTTIAGGALIGYRVTIGRGGYVGPGASVTHALIGDRVILHAGVRIGQDGFGFAMGPSGHLKVPQIGRVIIQDDVEIGANTTVDRGAMADTVIGEGTKIDNLVQIAHGVVIGRNVLMAAQVGIAGSTEVGDDVMFGGQVGVGGHLTIGRGVVAVGQSGITNSVDAGTMVAGYPAIDAREWRRAAAVYRRLPELKKRIEEIEARLAELQRPKGAE